MKVVGLTGGIGTGKSTVAAELARLGAHVIDADLIARSAVEPGRPAYESIVAEFGAGVLTAPHGAIDRAKLREAAFASAERKRVLERIVHPAVFGEMASQMQAVAAAEPHRVIILDVPLLYETGAERLVQSVIVVYASPPIQLERLMARDGLALAEAGALIELQMPMSEKCRRADWIINNSGELSATLAEVGHVWRAIVERNGHGASPPEAMPLGARASGEG